ncbi:MAG: hypothetical protein IID33_12585 [Planctomycetes bacterium]|nr:hypothetical protein [Planctomycetota bacterium]
MPTARVGALPAVDVGRDPVRVGQVKMLRSPVARNLSTLSTLSGLTCICSLSLGKMIMSLKML